MNTLTEQGVVISIADPDMGFPKFVFTATKVESEGRIIEGVSIAGQMADIRLEIDPATRKLVGWIRSPQLTRDAKILGELKYPTAPYFRAPQKPLPVQYFQGAFTFPNFRREEGTLYVYQSVASREDRWRAQFAFPFPESPKINFNYGVADRERRNLQLVVADPATHHFLKWIFAVVANQVTDEVTLIGMRFDTSYGRTTGASLVRKP